MRYYTKASKYELFSRKTKGAIAVGQKPLDAYTIKRINYLTHEAKLKQTAIAARLGIARTTVRRHVMTLAEYKEFKERVL